MTAYDFIKQYDPTEFAFMQAKAKYSFGDVASKLEPRRKALKARADYRDSKGLFIELTMSCNRDEAIYWMECWMLKAIAYGIETKNKDWATKFLAAYDLKNYLREDV